MLLLVYSDDLVVGHQLDLGKDRGATRVELLQKFRRPLKHGLKVRCPCTYFSIGKQIARIFPIAPQKPAKILRSQ